jgi:hypothetical protein
VVWVSVVQLSPDWHSGHFLDRTRSEADAAATDRAVEQLSNRGGRVAREEIAAPAQPPRKIINHTRVAVAVAMRLRLLLLLLGTTPA